MPGIKRTLSITDAPATTSRAKRRNVRMGTIKRALRQSKVSVYRFSRCLSQNFTWNPLSGLGASGADLCITNSLSMTDFIINGTSIASPSIPNASEFTNLFDQYRLKRIDYEIYWSQNLSNAGTAAPIPVVHIVNDYNTVASFSKSDIFQHPDLKTYQCDPQKPIKWFVYPHVRSDVLTNGGLVSSSAMNLRAPWIDTSSASIQHLGTLVYIDNLGRTTNADYGTFLFKVIYHMEFKNVK